MKAARSLGKPQSNVFSLRFSGVFNFESMVLAEAPLPGIFQALFIILETDENSAAV